MWPAAQSTPFLLGSLDQKRLGKRSVAGRTEHTVPPGSLDQKRLGKRSVAGRTEHTIPPGLIRPEKVAD